MTTRRKKIYEGKAKILYEGPEPGTLIQYFKDDTSAFNETKKAVLEGKGVINHRISEYFMTRLNSIGVQYHFIKRLNLRRLRAAAAGSHGPSCGQAWSRACRRGAAARRAHRPAWPSDRPLRPAG